MDYRDIGVPPYRIEHRSPDDAALILDYATTLPLAHVRLVRMWVRLFRVDAIGEVVLIDQDTELILERRSL